ncbi:hypothetical protein [Neisseria sp. Ec49-e6-T10]|uniref:hypothetical protein n=1 Tax=Neisseria sp. Ec49-e6-T10 TaxID=3140744 RepID=UPI003EBD86BF
MKRVLLSITILMFSPLAVADLAPQCEQYFNQVIKDLNQSIEEARTENNTDLVTIREELRDNTKFVQQYVKGLSTDQQVKYCEEAQSIVEHFKARLNQEQ